MSIPEKSEFLENVYQQLSFIEGDLLSATELPDMDSLSHWLNKGDWLVLAHKVAQGLEDAKIEKVFFVENNPVIIFGQADYNQETIQELFQRSWNMARPSFLFLALPGELRVYGLNKSPERDQYGVKIPEPIDIVRNINEISEKLSIYRREQLESGQTFEAERFGRIEERADQQLIKDLKIVRSALMKSGLGGKNLKYAHALIGRSIFIRYLEDRGIISEDYFKMIAERQKEWTALLNQPIEKNQILDDTDHKIYLKVLQNKDFTYALFQQLKADFNGDVFPQDNLESAVVQQEHLTLLRRFLIGDIDPQLKLFLWAYKFDLIPTDLISSIYEEFYHNEQDLDDKGTHYTPGTLVEFVLAQLLTPEKLAQNPRVLDPACGSGIFLVETFQRIVRYHIQKKRKIPSPDRLRKILQEQIAGIEVNSEAVRVAAFSLCLAFLNYQEPKDILEQMKLGRRLPKLAFNEGTETNQQNLNILLEADAFNVGAKITNPLQLRRFTENCADIVVGNPPWGAANNTAIQWCLNRELAVGDKEFSQAFIWLAYSLLRDRGCAGLLVTSGVFFKQQPNNKLFRKQLLEKTTLSQVVNFAHVRDIFFNGVKSPFAYLEYQKIKLEEENLVRYWSAKKTSVVNGLQVVILNNTDMRILKQSDLQYDDRTWKIYWWGSHRDHALINTLSMEPRLRDWVNSRNLAKGYGFQDKSKGKNSPSDWLKQYRVFPTGKFRSYGRIDFSFLKTVPEEVYRFGNKEIYKGSRILIKRGVTEAKGANGRIQARLEDAPFCFRHSIFGIAMDGLEEWEKKIILGVLWSSLTRYYLFHTTGSWGNWHHSVHLEEILDLPIRLPNDSELQNKIITRVDRLREFSGSENIFQVSPNYALASLEKELDDAIFELYELNEAERDLITDLCTYGLDLFYNSIHSDALKPIRLPSRKQGTLDDLAKSNGLPEGLEGYILAFLSIWNRELEPDGELSWRVVNSAGHAPMIGVIFSTKYKSQPIPVIKNTEDNLWHEVLTKLGNNILYPYNSKKIYVDGMVRAVTDTEIFVIKRSEARLWTRSSAREDAEATLVQAMNLQNMVRSKAR
ncbi:Type IIS restriction enzyme Eco57I [Pelotomaculum schinkii]|uniref:site-specific DNA-methyltransferase (adenine-specific) n=1 Tax=Pelotomaculum schinkii TaxID=78350 RepID=A0A4Y7RIL0_9FIRM|nr:N-6 DNA methylase [Pelotomaculum schinkii]TEB08653.1 Type IIS restriction enzyme Eco57I [Pelotomaculum schinkii]